MTGPSIIYQWLVTSLKISVLICLSCAVPRTQKQIALHILLEKQFHFVVVRRRTAWHPASRRSACWRRAPADPAEDSSGDDISEWAEQIRDFYEWVSVLMAGRELKRPAQKGTISWGNRCPSYSPALTYANEMNTPLWVTANTCSTPLRPLRLFLTCSFNHYLFLGSLTQNSSDKERLYGFYGMTRE